MEKESSLFCDRRHCEEALFLMHRCVLGTHVLELRGLTAGAHLAAGAVEA
jgi:hypothetical protein